MSNKILVNIIITTYDKGNGNRYGLLYKTIQGLKDNLIYPNLSWSITDDGSPNYEDMKNTVGEMLSPTDVVFFNTERKGVGYAKNNALRHAFQSSPMVLLLEDDWYLHQKFDLLRHVQHILDHPEVGMIRFGYIGGTTLEAQYIGYSPFDTYWTLKQGSDVYVYSGQVSLRHKVFYDKVGWHSEGISAGEEELDMCKRYNGTPDAPLIQWAAEYGTTLNAGPFYNIGLGDSTNAEMPNAG